MFYKSNASIIPLLDSLLTELDDALQVRVSSFKEIFGVFLQADDDQPFLSRTDRRRRFDHRDVV